MNPINRRGQKVVCVVDFEFEMGDGSVPKVQLPNIDEVCTVADFVDLSFALEDPANWPGITLVEHPVRIKRKDTGTWAPMGFPIIAFRPVDERQTDISELLPLGRVLEKETA